MTLCRSSPNATTTGRFNGSTSTILSTLLDGLQAPSIFSEAAQRHSNRGASTVRHSMIARGSMLASPSDPLARPCEGLQTNVRRLTDISIRSRVTRPSTIPLFDCDSSTNRARCHVRASMTTSSPTNAVMRGSMISSTSSPPSSANNGNASHH
ncbi:hypothetical protein K523DRAFT_131600 [Schizophyllum commune Tattone D]|nr:hypothetical protein K523DRAFT_131600 [Schizophyllum commune Tattone D]